MFYPPQILALFFLLGCSTGTYSSVETTYRNKRTTADGESVNTYSTAQAVGEKLAPGEKKVGIQLRAKIRAGRFFIHLR